MASIGFSVGAINRASGAFEEVARSIDGLQRELRALDKTTANPTVDVDTRRGQGKLAAFESAFNRLSGKTARVTVDADIAGAQAKVATIDKSFGSATIRVAALGRALGSLSLPAAIIGATPAIASLGASAVQASGALWLLPAAGAAGAVAIGALKVGMAGFGEAMKNLDDPAKFAEAVAKLSPAARDAANAVRGLVPAWTSMQQVVQQNLFTGVADAIRVLAANYLPVLQSGLGGAATAMRQLALTTVGYLNSAHAISSISGIFGNVGAAMTNLRTVGASLMSAFVDIAAVGSTFLPGLAAGASNAAARFAEFIGHARQSGQLAAWIQGGLGVLRQLGAIAGNVGSILGSMFGAARASGQSFLSTVEQITGRVAAALRTPEGAAALTQVFTVIRDVAGMLVDKLVTLWPAIAAAGGAFGALLQAAGPVADLLLQLVVSALVPLFNTVQWLAPVLGPLAVAFFAVSTATSVWTGVMKLATIAQGAYGVAVSVFSALLHPIATATKLWAAAQAGLNIVMAMNPIGIVVIALAALVAGIVLAWHHSESFRTAVIGAWNAIKTAAVAVFTWLGNFFSTVWNGIVTAASTAWNAVVSFITNLGPNIAAAATAAWNWLLTATTTAIDAVINFVALLPQRIMFAIGWLAGALINFAVTAWNGFTTGITTAWAATVAFFVSLPGRIGSFLVGLGASLLTFAVTAWTGFTNGLHAAWVGTVAFFTGLPGRIGTFLLGLGAILYMQAINAWNAFTNGITIAWNATIAFFVSLPGRIAGFFSGAGTWLLQVGLDLVMGLWNGIVGAWNGFLGWIGGLINSFIAGFKAGLGIASPSTIFAQIGGWLIQGLINGIQAAAVFLWNVITTVASTVVNLIMAGISALAGLWQAMWNGIVAIFTNVWNTIRAFAITTWNAIAGFFSGALAAFQAFFGAVWNAVVAFFVERWITLRNNAVAIWNAISAFFVNAFNAYRNLFQNTWNLISTIFSTVWNFIRNVAATVWNAISNFFVAAFIAYRNLFQNTWNLISTIFSTVWNWIRNTAVTIWNGIVAWFRAAFAAWSAFFKAVWDGILNVFRSVWGWLRDTAVNAWNWIRAWFEAAWAGFTGYFRRTWDNIVGIFDRIWSSITGIAARVWESVRRAFIDGINWVIRAINNFAGAINKVAGLLGFNINLHVDELRYADGGQIDAVRRKLGGTIETQHVIRRATGGGINAATGGMLPGYNKPGRDRLPAVAGAQHYRLDGGEYVVRRESTRAIGAAGMAAINQAARNPVDIVPRRREGMYRAGGVIRLASGGQLGEAAKRAVPGTRVTSTYRQGSTGYHGRNQAADLVGNFHAINQWIARTHGAATNELIYTPGINLLNGRPHTYSPVTRADHNDHVHWAMAGPLGGGGGLTGVIGDIAQALLRPVVEGLLSPLRNIVVPIRDNPMEGLGKRTVAGVGVKMIDFLVNLAGARDAEASAMGPAGPGSGPVVDQVRAVANRYGWGAGPQWDALSRLIQKESSWNPNAQNPTSTAYGLFQFLNSTWGTVGGRKTSNPGEQAEYGLRYIRGRYRDPIGALNFHNRNNWYDQGGLARGTGMMMKDVITPERVLSSQQTRAFEQLVAALASGRPQQLVAAGSLVNQLAASQQNRRGAGAGGAGDGGITVHIDSVTTPPGTTASGMAGSITRELRVAKHGGRYRR